MNAKEEVEFLLRFCELVDQELAAAAAAAVVVVELDDRPLLRVDRPDDDEILTLLLL